MLNKLETTISGWIAINCIAFITVLLMIIPSIKKAYMISKIKKIMTPSFHLDKRILHLLLIKSNGLLDLGLLSGKMGISLSLILYSIKIKQPVIKDYAFDLLDQIIDGVNLYTPIGLDSGLAGIGWGVEYLLQNKYAEGDSADICEALDSKLMQIDPRRIDDLSIDKGLEGLLHYVSIHIKGAIFHERIIPFDETYLKDLYTAVCVIPQDKTNKQMNVLIKNYKSFYENKDTIYYDANLSHFVGSIEINKTNFKTFPLGLKDGLSGYLIKKMN